MCVLFFFTCVFLFAVGVTVFSFSLNLMYRKNPGQRLRHERIDNIERELCDEYTKQLMAADDDSVTSSPLEPFIKVCITCMY